MESGDGLAMIRLPWLEQSIFHTFLITLLVMPFSITLNEIFMGLTILSWVVKLAVRKERINIPPLGWFFLIFLFVSIASAVASDYKFQGLRGVWDVTRYTITFILVIDIIQSPEQVKKVLWTLGFSTGIWVITGMIHQFLIAKRELFGLLKFFSLGNKNSIGQYLQMVLSLTIGLLLNNSFSSREKGVWISISLVSLFALFLSGSKTMWVAFVLTLFIFAFLKRSHKVLIGTGCLILLFVAAAFISGQVRDMGFSILKAMEAPSMQIRYTGWKQCYHMFIDNPLLGVGPKCFMLARDKYNIISDFGQAHNMVLQVACEMGIIGIGSLISWVVFYIYFIATYRKKVRDPIYLGIWFGGVGYLVTLAIGGITEPTIGGEHSQLFMTLVGLMHVGLESNGKDCGKIHSPKELI
jgi:O-antigen ligase